MYALSATDVAMKLAHKNGTLDLQRSVGRFGEYVAICDDRGLICVANDLNDAREILWRAGVKM